MVLLNNPQSYQTIQLREFVTSIIMVGAKRGRIAPFYTGNRPNVSQHWIASENFAHLGMRVGIFRLGSTHDQENREWEVSHQVTQLGHGAQCSHKRVSGAHNKGCGETRGGKEIKTENSKGSGK